jgi:Fe-S cluster biogenesis protein NfuA
MIVKQCGECRKRVEVVIAHRGGPRLAQHGGDGRTFWCKGSGHHVQGLRPTELKQVRHEQTA